MSILIVDDNRNMRRAIKLAVKDLVDEIYECKDGSEALTAYAAHLPDWVFMDIRMKHLDGLTATRQVKAVFPDARIVIVTVFNGADLREAAKTAGAYAYIVKDNLLELRDFLSRDAVARKPQSITNR